MTSYEEVLDQVTAIPKGEEGHDRLIRWLDSAGVVGAARDHMGHVELFLTGPALNPRTRTLRDAIHHHSWSRENGVSLEANRLLFPPFGHYDPIAAFIASELLREGADDDLPKAFAITEPLIELAIERLELSGAALLGLAGELLLLDALARQIEDVYVGRLVEAWDGWRRSARDLAWDGTAVEVKTTTRPTSSHLVHGTHQVEPALADDSTPGEERLLLVSVGLQPSTPSSNSFTVPQLVERVAGQLETSGNGGAVGTFLAHVAEYGAESGFGYHHPEMSNDAPFDIAFTPSFVRGYDVDDPRVQVLRHADVASHQHVDAESLTFRIELPAVISASNPVDGLHRVADTILRHAA